MSEQLTRYPLAIRVLHWFMALSIFGLIASGWYMADLPDDAANKYALYPLHKSFGVLMIITFAARLVVRLRRGIPALPAVLKQWELKAAHAGHLGLYVLMLAVPVSGYVMSGSYEGSHGIDFFGLTLPRIVPTNDSLFSAAHWLHGVLPWVLLALVIVHVAGALKHRWFDEQDADVLPRMLGSGRTA